VSSREHTFVLVPELIHGVETELAEIGFDIGQESERVVGSVRCVVENDGV
jgi:hypothetical protein